MAHIPMEDIQLLWDKLGGNKSWSGLHLRLKEQQAPENIHDKSIDDDTAYSLLWEVRNLEGSEEPFPDTPELLYEFLNRRVSNQGFQESRPRQGE